jgi:hypothetical protein
MPLYYYTRLNGPRPTFPMDVNEQEREVMGAHAAYWKRMMSAGKVAVYGPVMDPRAVFGMGVLCVEDEAELERLLADDPVSKAGLGSYEYHPMKAVLP